MINGNLPKHPLVVDPMPGEHSVGKGSQEDVSGGTPKILAEMDKNSIKIDI